MPDSLDEDLAVDESGRTETGLERLGLWGLSWQLLHLVSILITQTFQTLTNRQMPVVLALWSFSPAPADTLVSPSRLAHLFTPLNTPVLQTFSLFFFLSLSRLGLWIYDLTTQQLTQTMTRPSQRSSFTGVEYSFASAFELCSYLVAILFSRPQDFKWIAGISWLAVAVSTASYAGWVWHMRGHLVHWEKLSKGCECVTVRLGRKNLAQRWSRVSGEDGGSLVDVHDDLAISPHDR